MKINSLGEHSTLCLAVDSAALRLLVLRLAHGVAVRPGSEHWCHGTTYITPQPLASGAWPGIPSAPPFPLGIVGGSRSVQAVKELQNVLQKRGMSLDAASTSAHA